MQASSTMMLVVAMTAAGCASMVKQLPHERSGSFPMPDVTGQTEAEARSTLASAGITGTIEVDTNYVCHDDHVATAHVCTTQPPAGNPTGADLPVTLHLRPEAEKQFVMPDLSGQTDAQARATLVELGEDPARIRFETLPNDPGDGCQAARVCRQSPSPGQPGYARGPVLLDLGPAGAGAHAAPAPTPTATPASTTSTSPARPAPKPGQPSPAKETKPKDTPPKPLF